MQPVIGATFLSLDANDWVALGTWALVVATILLWVVALRTLKDQRRITILLQRPYLRVSNPILTPLNNEKSFLLFNIENTGHSTANDLKVALRYNLNTVESDQDVKMLIGHLQTEDSFGITIPIPVSYSDLLSKEIPFSFVAVFVYSDIEKESNSYTYAAEYNYKLSTFTISRRAFK
jgi:hypothetical protein